jgi:hypothetical protein
VRSADARSGRRAIGKHIAKRTRHVKRFTACLLVRTALASPLDVD